MVDQERPGPANHRSARRWLVSGLVITLVAAMVAHVWRSHEELAALQRVSAPVLILTLLVQFLSQLSFNSALLLPLRTYVKTLGYWEFFVVRTGGFLAGYVVPVAGGLAVRLSYLRRRGLAYADFTWATLLSNVLALAAAGVLAVLATGMLWMVAGAPPTLLLGLSAGVLALGATALAVFQALPRLAGHPRLQRWRWLSVLSGFHASRRTTTWVFAHSLVRHTLNFVTFGWLYQALSPVPGGFLTGGLVYAVASPLRMIQITPGNLGVDEWVAAIVGKMLAFDVTTGLIVALVFRGLTLLSQGLGVLVAWAWLALRSEP